MNKEKLKQTIKWMTLGWVIINATLFGLFVGRIIPENIFQYGFVGGFLIWAALATVLFKFLQDEP